MQNALETCCFCYENDITKFKTQKRSHPQIDDQ